MKKEKKKAEEEMSGYPVPVPVPRAESIHHKLYEFAKTALIKIFVHPYATVSLFHLSHFLTSNGYLLFFIF